MLSQPNKARLRPFMWAKDVEISLNLLPSGHLTSFCALPNANNEKKNINEHSTPPTIVNGLLSAKTFAVNNRASALPPAAAVANVAVCFASNFSIQFKYILSADETDFKHATYSSMSADDAIASERTVDAPLTCPSETKEAGRASMCDGCPGQALCQANAASGDNSKQLGATLIVLFIHKI